MTEIDKYRGIYSNPKQYRRYGHSNHGARAVGMLREWKPQSLVDIGCGFNEFAKEMMASVSGLRAVGVDFACPGADVIADAKALPFSDKEFDVLTSFDAMEHLAPNDVDAVLSECARVSNRFAMSISYVPSVNLWRGQTLHPTVRSERWWVKRLVMAGAVAVEKCGRYIIGRWAPRLRMATDARVILVGNGPSVLEGELGEKIDAHDEVVRFNNFHLKGFEKHTGDRTTLWCPDFRGLATDERCARILCIDESMKPLPECTEVHHMAHVFYERMISDVQARARYEYGLKSDMMADNVERLKASSGLMVATYLLEIVGVQKLTLAGFDHFKKDRSQFHHYWIPRSTKRPTRQHDGDIEALIFADLVRSGRACYLQH